MKQRLKQGTALLIAVCMMLCVFSFQAQAITLVERQRKVTFAIPTQSEFKLYRTTDTNASPVLSLVGANKNCRYRLIGKSKDGKYLRVLYPNSGAAEDAQPKFELLYVVASEFKTTTDTVYASFFPAGDYHIGIESDVDAALPMGVYYAKPNGGKLPLLQILDPDGSIKSTKEVPKNGLVFLADTGLTVRLKDAELSDTLGYAPVQTLLSFDNSLTLALRARLRHLPLPKGEVLEAQVDSGTKLSTSR